MSAMQQEAPASALSLNPDSADNSDACNQPLQKPCQSVEILTANVRVADSGQENLMWSDRSATANIVSCMTIPNVAGNSWMLSSNEAIIEIRILVLNSVVDDYDDIVFAQVG